MWCALDLERLKAAPVVQQGGGEQDVVVDAQAFTLGQGVSQGVVALGVAKAPARMVEMSRGLIEDRLPPGTVDRQDR